MAKYIKYMKRFLQHLVDKIIFYQGLVSKLCIFKIMNLHQQNDNEILWRYVFCRETTKNLLTLLRSSTHLSHR